MQSALCVSVERGQFYRLHPAVHSDGRHVGHAATCMRPKLVVVWRVAPYASWQLCYLSKIKLHCRSTAATETCTQVLHVDAEPLLLHKRLPR
jgi:hypothetical protein